MTTRVRVEFGHLGEGIVPGVPAQNVVRKIVATLAPINVGTTATASADRPTVPEGDGGSPLYAFVRALGGSLVAAWGANPTAGETGADRKWIGEGEEHALLVEAGMRLSFVAVA